MVDNSVHITVVYDNGYLKCDACEKTKRIVCLLVLYALYLTINGWVDEMATTTAAAAAAEPRMVNLGLSTR